MSIADIFSRVSFGNFRAEFFQMRRHFGLFLIRPGHAKAKVGQHFGYARHADAADAYKMNMLETTKHVWSVDILSAVRRHPCLRSYPLAT